MTTRPAEPAEPEEPAAPGVSGVRAVPADPEAALEGRLIVLGVSGGIAAYKAVEVCRRLVDAGAHVSPVLTEGALRFVGAATFSALASEPAHTSLFEDGEPIPHTALGRRADLVIVAPATARVIGAYAAGISSDLLVATLLATAAPVLVCPAMHAEMWEHPAVQENLATLRRRGVHVIEPDVGRLAGGDEGPGRLAEPAEIVAGAAAVLSLPTAGAAPGTPAAPGAPAASGAPAAIGAPAAPGTPAASGAPTRAALRPRRRDLDGVRMLVTAGGTREPIDPVRFIGNRSSGKQGHALAAAARERGADVTLVTTVGETAPQVSRCFEVETAAQMAELVLGMAGEHDVIVMAAAVADFRPVTVAPSKLRKSAGVPRIELEPTTDILTELGRKRRDGQLLVGFAAETDDVSERAAGKLRSKGVDLVVANDVGAEGVGFSHETNAVTIVAKDGESSVPLSSKRAVADAVLDVIAERLASDHRASALSGEGAQLDR